MRLASRTPRREPRRLDASMWPRRQHQRQPRRLALGASTPRRLRRSLDAHHPSSGGLLKDCRISWQEQCSKTSPPRTLTPTPPSTAHRQPSQYGQLPQSLKKHISLSFDFQKLKKNSGEAPYVGVRFNQRSALDIIVASLPWDFENFQVVLCRLDIPNAELDAETRCMDSGCTHREQETMWDLFA